MPSAESPDAIIEEFYLRLEQADLSAFVMVDVNPVDGGGLSLDRIIVDDQQRGKHYADQTVAIFVRVCDEYAQDAEVIPKPLDERTTLQGLVTLYERHGFVRVNANQSLMRRRCRPVAAMP